MAAKPKQCPYDRSITCTVYDEQCLDCVIDEQRQQEGLNLKQCPYCPATKCAMDEPCNGCETYAQWECAARERRK